ncbi:hypothetical protein L21_2604 [Methanoculleus chikugoensis]|uniref:Uncharacterized protein n=1 Tax=Methanoculleus chikugoensis TaxID=118126 RepID=A0A1M4MP72_9EURY|nr:hypothetical protein [Methanoculleus chikugoensis]MDD4568298.1 hypothetical protein [Methanoculleus chikugoensis]SCL76666.1 hypothetical protein L21_2604 [Methanoculleus chikugoensis]
MSMLRLLITAGAAFYVVVFLAQAARNWGVAGQAIAGVVLLAAVTALTWMHDELTLKRSEMTLLWVMVLGFLAYAAAHALGVLA